MTDNLRESGPRAVAAAVTQQNLVGAARAVADSVPPRPSEGGIPPAPYPADPAGPAVPVPPDAHQVDEDIIVSDNMVAVTKSGSVIDTAAGGTVISLPDGTRVTVGTDGMVTLDPDFRNPGTVVDANTMHGPGTYISADGTQVQILDGKVVITNPFGEKLTVFPNGSVKIDVPDPGAPPAHDMPTSPDPAPEPAEEPGGGGGGPSGGGGGPSGGGGDPSGGGGGPSGGGSSGGGGEPPAMPPTPTPAAPGHQETPNEPAEQPETPPTHTPPAHTPPSTPTTPPVHGRDIRVTPADLVKDAAYFTQQASNAQAVAQSFASLTGLIREYGLWFGARPPYQQACQQFSSLYAGGARQMTEISGSLTKAAKLYQTNEERGEELAEGIF